MKLTARSGTTMATDEAAAVAEIREQVEQVDMRGVLFFCSPDYNLDRLAARLEQSFSVPLVGCTTAGQISGVGYQRGGMTALSLAGSLHMSTHLITPLSACQRIAASVGRQVIEHRRRPGAPTNAFGLILVDGMSLAEERLAAAVYQAVGEIPIIGGSAGDNLAFQTTHVYHDGRFVTDAALFSLFETEALVTTFKLSHFLPSKDRLIVTRADPERRIVHELNGEPAAEVYAAMLGLPETALATRVFSTNPVTLQVAGECYVRSIRQANPDRSLSFYCAIEEGLVLFLGRRVDPLEQLRRTFGAVDNQMRRVEVVIGCDCILRRLELEQSGLDGKVGEYLASRKVIGFSTYGEQYNAIHMNQTFTGVAIGYES